MFQPSILGCRVLAVGFSKKGAVPRHDESVCGGCQRLPGVSQISRLHLIGFKIVSGPMIVQVSPSGIFQVLSYM